MLETECDRDCIYGSDAVLIICTDGSDRRDTSKVRHALIWYGDGMGSPVGILPMVLGT